MRREATILGTGKMARDIGAFLVNRGYSLTWISREYKQLAGVEKQVQKITRRLKRFSPETEVPAGHLYTTYEQLTAPIPSVIIEATIEELEAKRKALKKIEPLMEEDSLVFSNSSSILPSEIGEGILGLHFFYPVELTGFVEIVFGQAAANEEKQRALRLVESLGLDYIVQDEKRAYAVNRLLLPLQNRVMGALMEGVPAQMVDECSTSDLLPVGQLSLMKSVGLSTICESVKNYSRRESDSDYSTLIEGLKMLIDGRPMPRSIEVDDSKLDSLKKELHSTFVDTCLQFIERRELTSDELETILADVFGARVTFAEAVEGQK